MSTHYPERINLREVGPRDGFQNIERFIATADKLDVIAGLADAGLKVMEVTSFVSEKVIPQMADANEILAATAGKGFVRSVLVPTPKRAEAAIAAGADELIVFLSASEAHNKANVNRTISESVAGLEQIFAMARDAGTRVVGALAVSFGCPYEGHVPSDKVMFIADIFRKLGCDQMIFGDTTGMATPPAVETMVKSFQDRFSDNNFSLHFHNNRGTAMVNLMAAMAAGAETFDTAVAGTGGCPTVPQAAGNLATEDVVYLLNELGIETGVDLERVIAVARHVEEIVGYGLPGQVMKSGPCDWHPGRQTAVH